jgi:hypothetical protein
MGLTDSQIERYSRQIVLPGVGGRGQERLLRARIRLIAEADYLEPALGYLAGAGVGRIALGLPGIPTQREHELRLRMRELNPDVEIETGRAAPGEFELDLCLISGPASLAAALRPTLAQTTIAARLDRATIVAVIRSRPPCIRCVDQELAKPIRGAGAQARICLMAALAEVIRQFAAEGEEQPRSKVIRIKDYSSSVELVQRDRRCARCVKDSGGRPRER